MAGAKWQGFPSGGKAESLSLFSSSSIAEKSGGIFSSLPANLPTPNVLLVFARPSSILMVCNSNSSLPRSEEHTSELQSRLHLVCRLLLEKKKTQSSPFA